MLNLSRTLENNDVTNDTFNIPNKNDIKTVRIVGQNIQEIEELKDYQSLEKLNISFSKIKKIPILNSLQELQMIEVDLDDYNDLLNLKNLKKLKLSNDNFELMDPMYSVEILHVSSLHHPEKLYKYFPNLKQLRFEIIDPNIKDKYNENYDKNFYKNLEYIKFNDSKTIFFSKNGDYDDFKTELGYEIHIQMINEYHEFFYKGLIVFCNNNLCINNENGEMIKKYDYHYINCRKFVDYPIVVCLDNTNFELRNNKLKYKEKFECSHNKDPEKKHSSIYCHIISNLFLKKNIDDLLVSNQFEENDTKYSCDYFFNQMKNQVLNQETITYDNYFLYMIYEYCNYFLHLDYVCKRESNDIYFPEDDYEDDGNLINNLDDIKNEIYMNGKKYLLSFTDKVLFYIYDMMIGYDDYNLSELDEIKKSLNEEFLQENQKIIDKMIVSDDTIRLSIDNSDEYKKLVGLIFKRIEIDNSSDMTKIEECDFTLDNIMDQFHSYLMNRLNVDKNHTTANTSTFFIGKSSNLNEYVVKNYENHLFIGYSSLIGFDIFPYISKSFNSKIKSCDLYFINNNNVYSNYMMSNLEKLTKRDYFSNENGVFGWGGEFFNHDVLLKPHPNVINENDIVINSPLKNDIK